MRATLFVGVGVCLLAVAWGMGMPLQGAANLPCAEYSTCHECIRNLDCGWCTPEGEGATAAPSCIKGDSLGPQAGSCASWDYQYCATEPCNVYTNCWTCIADPFCGWCAASQSCMDGNEGGPSVGMCKDWDHDSCPEV